MSPRYGASRGGNLGVRRSDLSEMTVSVRT